jgi:hypothetical protein
MVYPGSGIPVSTGSAWGTSLTKVGTDTGALTAGGSITSGNPICGDANGGGNGGVCKTPIAIPFESSTTSSSQVLWMSQFTVAYTVPSSCSGSKLYALTGATASATFTLYDVTTTTTLCTATFASGGSGGTESATWSGSGGTISAGDIVEWISGSSDVSLLGTGGQILVTR